MTATLEDCSKSEIRAVIRFQHPTGRLSTCIPCSLYGNDAINKKKDKIRYTNGELHSIQGSQV